MTGIFLTERQQEVLPNNYF